LAKSSVDVPLLALFRAPAKQDDECLTILTEVNPAAGSEVELVLEHSMTDTFDVREIAERDPGHGHCYLQRPRYSDYRTMSRTGCGPWCRDILERRSFIMVT
jgi:hypothetical protein